LWALAVSVGLALSVWPQPASAQRTTELAGAGGGVFPEGASLNDVPLNGLRFGFGIDIAADGTAEGVLESTLLGTSTSGQPQIITIDGSATHGSIVAPGVATASGVCSVDMGDGTPPVSGVLFTLMVSANSQGQGTLTLAVGSTNLPEATVGEGSLTVPVCNAPPEVGQSVIFLDGQTLSWTALSEASSYNVYRGSIDGGSWAFDHVCFATALPNPAATDASNPSRGLAFYYLVSAKNVCGESTLGATSAGQPRPNASPCP
jgi:hypothetical protein